MRIKIDGRDLNRIAFYGLLLIAVLLFQTVAPQRLGFNIVKPSFAIAAVISAGIFGTYRTGAIFGAVLGFIIDCTAGYYVGLNAIILMLSGLAAGILTYKLFWRNMAAAYLLLTGCYAAKAIFNIFWFGAIILRYAELAPVLKYLALEYVFTAFYLPFIFLIVKHLSLRLTDLD